MKTLINLMEETAAAYGDRSALTMEGSLGPDVWSYRRLWRAAHAVA